jgi:hypothetical protein
LTHERDYFQLNLHFHFQVLWEGITAFFRTLRDRKGPTTSRIPFSHENKVLKIGFYREESWIFISQKFTLISFTQWVDRRALYDLESTLKKKKNILDIAPQLKK